MRGILCLLLLLGACARPLAPAERDFARTVHGPALDMNSVRLHRAPLISPFDFVRPPRPPRTCRERIRPPETAPIRASYAAVALFERVVVDRRYWAEDFLSGYPETLDLAQAMFLAHELTHVWQWQARGRTGYHPLRAATEHAPGVDPYLWRLAPGLGFLDYPYEQQGALVEEFVCCRALDPEGARTEALHRLLAPVFPGIARRTEAVEILIPWADAPRQDICKLV